MLHKGSVSQTESIFLLFFEVANAWLEGFSLGNPLEEEVRLVG